MNIDLLENNPSWTWYPIVSGGLIILTISGWLLYKISSVSLNVNYARCLQEAYWG